ncbi:MAG: PorP/SprF family type IX secretion system membrane protein [Bacteroidetes bacterium]|nr:PorP/SprF family type IX secretion system membrane protein [Bacteroidota bacterium]
MMITIKKIILSGSILICSYLNAQDVHFSQFFNAPLSINPALTGNIEGNIRAVVNHKNQWNSISTPFVTSSASFDSKLFEDRLKGDDIGVGIEILNDKVGEGGLSNTQVMLNTSYQKKFGLVNQQSISIGFKYGFFQRKIDFSKLSFANQYIDGDFNTNISNGENSLKYRISNFDLSTGILYNIQTQNDIKVNGGISVFHLTRPNESLTGGTARIPTRFLFHSGSIIIVNQNIIFKPAFLFMSQNKAKEINLGGQFDQTLNTTKNSFITINYGAFYRISDAIILLAGAKYQNWNVCFTYDINASKLHPGSNYKGGFELSIIYVNKLLPGKNKLPVWVPCVRL